MRFPFQTVWDPTDKNEVIVILAEALGKDTFELREYIRGFFESKKEEYAQDIYPHPPYHDNMDMFIDRALSVTENADLQGILVISRACARHLAVVWEGDAWTTRQDEDVSKCDIVLARTPQGYHKGELLDKPEAVEGLSIPDVHEETRLSKRTLAFKKKVRQAAKTYKLPSFGPGFNNIIMPVPGEAFFPEEHPDLLDLFLQLNKFEHVKTNCCTETFSIDESVLHAYMHKLVLTKVELIEKLQKYINENWELCSQLSAHCQRRNGQAADDYLMNLTMSRVDHFHFAVLAAATGVHSTIYCASQDFWTTCDKQVSFKEDLIFVWVDEHKYMQIQRVDSPLKLKRLPSMRKKPGRSKAVLQAPEGSFWNAFPYRDFVVPIPAGSVEPNLARQRTILSTHSLEYHSCSCEVPDKEQVIHAFCHKFNMNKNRVLEILRRYIQNDKAYVQKIAESYKRHVNGSPEYTVNKFIDDLLDLHERTKLPQLLFLSKAFNTHSRVFCRHAAVSFQSQRAVPQNSLIIGVQFIADKLDKLKLLRRQNEAVYGFPQDK